MQHTTQMLKYTLCAHFWSQGKY